MKALKFTPYKAKLFGRRKAFGSSHPKPKLKVQMSIVQ